MLKHIPNILTIIRFLLIPVIIILLLNNQFLFALLVFTISSITDILDGIIARKFDLITDFGKLMDPLADKLTQISMLAVLSILNIIPFWIMFIFVVKEVILISGASFLYGKDVVVYSKWFGKLATVLLFVAIVTSLLLSQFEVEISQNNFISKFVLNMDYYLYITAIATTLFSLVMYTHTLYKKGLIEKGITKTEKQRY